jgi:apolipoprotein N-acyltransferase
MALTTQLPQTASLPGRLALSLPLLLLSGGALVFLTSMRLGIAELAWVTFAPVLVYLHERGTLKRHLGLLSSLLITWLATVSKIAAGEIPWTPVPMDAVAIALSCFVALTIAGVTHHRLEVRFGAYTFASMAVLMGWIQYTFTEGASWGVLAHTQVDNLPLVQLAALTGVVSPVAHKAFPEVARNVNSVRALDNELLACSACAADLGARAVVWNEIATLASMAVERAGIASIPPCY